MLSKSHDWKTFFRGRLFGHRSRAYPRDTMSHQVIFKDRKVSHRSIRHRRERALAIFGNDDISPPRVLLPEALV